MEILFWNGKSFMVISLKEGACGKLQKKLTMLLFAIMLIIQNV